MEISVKDRLPEEGKMVRVWCRSRSGRRAWGEYKILAKDGITLYWCDRRDNIATELLHEYTPETWEKL